MAKTKQRLESLIIRGFDDSHVIRGGLIKIKCSACQAAKIGGVPCHETGCPNATHGCHGCDEAIPVKQKYCQDCL